MAGGPGTSDEVKTMNTFSEELEDIFGPTDSHEYAEARLALEIAVQFAALRERRGLSQRQVAERLGRSQQAVSKIENPTHGGHNLARLKAALEALDATLDVTIVPLEDLAAYDACRPPKPALEDINRRVTRRPPADDAVLQTFRGSSRRAAVKPSGRIASPVKKIAAEKKQPVSNQLLRQRPLTVPFGLRRP